MKKQKTLLKVVASILVVTTLLATISFPTSESAKNDVDSELTYTSDQINTNHQIEKPIVNDNIVYENELVDTLSDSLLCAQDSKILDYVNVESFKTSAHIARIEELEELNTYVFQNADGTRSVYLMNENVKYIDSKGIVKEKDISLIKKDKGYVLAQSNIDLLLPNNPTDGVDIGFSDYDIKLTPQITNSSTVRAARKDDNTVIYDSFFGNNTALAYTPLLSGVKEDIILYSYIDNASFTFVLETDGLGVYNDQKGYYLAENPKDEKVFRIGEIILYDEVGKPGNGYINITTVSEREKYILTVTADEEYLTDETTVYPVTIDPSITVSDNDTGTNSIVDCPIFEGFPNANYGAYIYNRVGTPSGSYGVGRTAIKLDGLVSSNEYNTISSSQITDVTFYVRASGGSSVYVNVYPITGNTTWTETTLTWYNIGSHDTSVNYGGTLGKNTTNGFNITDLVKAWKDGTYSSSAGFVMISSDESSNKSFCSSEFSDTTKRPYVVMTYETDLSISDSQLNVYEGETITLTATTSPAGQPVTWSSSDTLVATVDQSGVVTGVHAGQVNISATYTDTDGVTHTVVCSVYVILPNGVYYFNNVASDYGIEFVNESSYGENEPLTAWERDATEPVERFKLFKLSYLGNGLYSIRSMLDNTKGWTRYGTQLVSTTIGTTDSSVPMTAQWYIRHNGSGYYIYSRYGTSRTVTCPDDIYEDWNIVLSSYSPTNVMQSWVIEKIDALYRGIDIREKKTSMSIGETYTFVATTYSTYDGEYSLALCWETGNFRIASVGYTTGEVLAKNSGDTSVTVYMDDYPATQTSVTLTVKPQTTQTSGIKSGSVYMIKNVSKNKYLKAADSNVLTLASQDEMDGKQLWYVEWTGSAYKLYSMGIKATLPGSSESLLVGNNASNSPRVSTQTSTANWTISYYNGYYYLVNNSTLFRNTSISAVSANNYIRHVSLESETAHARWEFEEIDTATFNNYWEGDFLGQGDTIYVKINIESSGTDSVYSNSIISPDDFDVINQWKNKSSHVVIYGPNDTVPSNVSAFEVTFRGYVPSGTTEINGTKYSYESFVLGETNGYKKVSSMNKIASINEDWSHVIISLNTSSAGPLVGDDALIRKVIIHELGHALKLAHPKQVDDIQSVPNAHGPYADDNSVCALMNQGDPNDTSNLTCATPKWHDIINLRNKWGD